MDSLPPQSVLKPGQRALAAIVFTDVVSFSARMQADEETTLRLLHRDFSDMRAISAQHHGSVLKTTGDGLLLYFSSAVQAVACALAMQRHFADVAKKNPPQEALVHRVGIHLGDVFVSEQDVMGDGVNIAARLQAEAEPGGICISQTVYDVVKNKLELHVTSLGARELKNISESIPIYRLLLDAQSWREAQATAALEAESAAQSRLSLESRPANAWWRKPAVIWSGIVLLVVALGLSIAGTVRMQNRLKRQLAETEAAHAALAEALEEKNADAGKDVEEYARALNNTKQPALQARDHFLTKYNFAGLAQFLRGKEGQGMPALLKSAEQMTAMRFWVMTALQNYTQQQPLRVAELTGTAPKELQVFAKPDRQLYFVEGGAVRGRDWSEVKPAWIGAIIVSTLLEAKQPPGREVVQGVQAFARIYSQPEMIDTLRRLQLRRAPKS